MKAWNQTENKGQFLGWALYLPSSYTKSEYYPFQVFVSLKCSLLIDLLIWTVFMLTDVDRGQGENDLHGLQRWNGDYGSSSIPVLWGCFLGRNSSFSSSLFWHRLKLEGTSQGSQPAGRPEIMKMLTNKRKSSITATRVAQGWIPAGITVTGY